MHFTLWPSLAATTGGYAQITTADLRDFIARPADVPRKEDGAGWSPAKFRDDRRGKAFVESVSLLVLDVDTGDPEIARLRIFAWRGIAHSSWSHAHSKDGTPDLGVRKWRIILELSRDVTPEEHARLWDHARAHAAASGIELDPAARDASRFWFCPARRSPAAPYEWCPLEGDPVDVGAWLAAVPESLARNSSPTSSPRAPSDPGQRAAEALGRAWPARGRHQAQLALAGALRGEGWPADRTLDFLCTVCRAAGDEDRPKREATVRHTYERQADAPTTGWTRLTEHVPALVVDAVRGAVGREAGFETLVRERLAAAAAERRGVIPINSESLVVGGCEIHLGADLAAPMPDLEYLVRELGLVAGGGAPHLVAGYGFSGKTFAMQAMLLALAAGAPVWGAYSVARPLRVLHVDLEQGALTQRRYQRLAQAMGIDMRALENRLAVAVMPRIKLARDPDGARWIDLMGGRDLLLVDSLRASCGGSENESEFRDALDLLGEVSHATGCRAAVVHHAKKPSADDTEARYSIRGSSAIYDAVDSAYVFSGARAEPVRVEHVKARSHGDLEQDRALVFRDVASGGDPKGGIRIDVIGAEALATAKAVREREERLAQASADASVVRQVLVRQPGLGSRELRAAVKAQGGMGADRCENAIATLGDSVERREEIWNRTRIVKHYWTGK